MAARPLLLGLCLLFAPSALALRSESEEGGFPHVCCMKNLKAEVVIWNADHAQKEMKQCLLTAIVPDGCESKCEDACRTQFESAPKFLRLVANDAQKTSEEVASTQDAKVAEQHKVADVDFQQAETEATIEAQVNRKRVEQENAKNAQDRAGDVAKAAQAKAAEEKINADILIADAKMKAEKSIADAKVQEDALMERARVKADKLNADAKATAEKKITASKAAAEEAGRNLEVAGAHHQSMEQRASAAAKNYDDLKSIAEKKRDSTKNRSMEEADNLKNTALRAADAAKLAADKAEEAAAFNMSAAEKECTDSDCCCVLHGVPAYVKSADFVDLHLCTKHKVMGAVGWFRSRSYLTDSNDCRKQLCGQGGKGMCV